ncbi:DUF3540 domain-containing protein [Variovorax sp.]|uniref:DUF3540 domain-containing protein n=1 Tax=Variovorax sp. TaxID=1871043 RepID=UPI0013851228|nr:DUF3540 domain-containing protein [Variovorax sp.]KAF1070024.1 MAG: hypothetical protein GAK39_02257 [Variovorax sp.]
MSPAALRERASAPTAHDAPDMQTLLRRPLPAPAAWTGNALGTVLQALPGDAFLVEAQAGGERWHCPRAASCLLQPSVGDTVLVAGPRRDQAYLIAVITQADPAQARLAVDGVLTLQAGTRLELAAPELDLQARKAQLEVGEMDYRGGEVRITTLVARFVGRTCETVLDRLSVLTRSSFRLTEEVEQVRAGQIDYQAEETLRLHAKNTLVSSKGLVKVDGEQIHMG